MLEVVQTLRNHHASMRLRDRAISGCWKWIHEAIRDGELPNFVADDIELRFQRCALIFDSALVSYPYVETAFSIHALRKPTATCSTIGSYRLITGLDGADIDDYFVLDAGSCTSSIY